MKHIKCFGSICVYLLFSIVMGTMLLYGAFLLPVDKIDEHVAISSQIIYQEQTYPELSRYFSSKLDNWTDSIMLLEAANDAESSTIERAMASFRCRIATAIPTETLIRHYIGGEVFDEIRIYPTYWHGYLIFLKPILLFFTLYQIRIINGAIQALLFFFTCLLMIKRNKDFYLIPWMLGYFMLMPIVLAKSLQYSSCYYVYMFGSLALLLIPGKKLMKYAPFLFLNIGIATAYFDFLTYPIATFGVPMLINLVLLEGTIFKEKILAAIKNGVMWCIGYGAMWVSKWFLASFFLKRDVVYDALSEFVLRTSSYSSDNHLSKAYVVLSNYKEFFRTPVTCLALVCLIYCVYLIIKNWRSISIEAIKTFMIYIVVGLAPAVWYAFATNHSAVHYWFTNKACIVTFLSILFGIVSLIEKMLIKEMKNDGATDSSNSNLQ